MPTACQYARKGVVTRIAAAAEGILRITRTRRTDFLGQTGPAVVLHSAADCPLIETAQSITFTAGSVTVRVNKLTGALSFLDAQGSLLLREPDRRPFLLEEKPVLIHRYDKDAKITESASVDGARASATASEVCTDRTAYECRQHFVFDNDEGLYGLGSHEEGYGNLRGKSRLLYQHNMKAVVPFLVSTKGYGILFDMGCAMAFHDDENGSYLWADCADELDWYFLYGDGSYASLMEKHRLLTGETPLLPKYALGYVQSKERYVDAEEMIAVADEYRRRKIPLDVIVLDWQSWPEGQWGWKHFDETRFPDPRALTDALHDRNVRMMLSIWPSMQGEKNEDRAEMLEKGFMLGNKLIYNAFDPAARAQYWQQANNALFRHGVDAWWCDCSEPFESDWHGPIKPEPHLRFQMNVDEAKRYLDPARLSLYSIYHSQGIYEGQRSVTGEKRVCNLTRSSWAGQHRYAAITWSGDVSANWETLRRHVPEGLNFCAAGEAYWSTDIGAFFPNGNWDPWFYEGDYDTGMDDLGYRELFVRWGQYAAFLPMMRAHGTGTPREIWRLGEPSTPFHDAYEKAIRLRYTLLPYLYSLMAGTRMTGQPMLRTPALVFPADPSLRRIDDQMLLGDALLVKPVTRAMYYGPGSVPLENADRTETVVLPAGHGWYAFGTAERFEGGQTVTVDAPLDTIPMFVRSGSILPLGADVQHSGELSHAPLTIAVYPGADAVFTLYDDAGDGYGYEQGEYTEIPMTWKENARILTIGARQGTYPGMPEATTLRIQLAGGPVTEVRYTGETIRIQL
nr:DUF5110 domain-containing protein [Clostridia bacterium]